MSSRTLPLLRSVAAAAGLLMAVAASLLLLLRSTPRPIAVVIRLMFDRNSRRTAKLLGTHVPHGLLEVMHQQYLPGDANAYLDVFYPASTEGTGEALPTVVWIHGGAWISGSKKDVANYLRILASHGFTAVGVDYSLAHTQKYPAPVRQAAAALEYLQQHAARLHIDAGRLVLAGDSAGAQIAAQLALLITDPAYAGRLRVAPPVGRSQLRAVLLYCGGYDLSLVGNGGSGSQFLRTVLWSYTGARDFMQLPDIDLASVNRHVGPDFPPAFITAGNADPLLQHSLALADALTRQGTDVETLFYDEDHLPRLGHEYQFNLNEDAARQALARSVAFLRRTTIKTAPR
jgi:acetyl esterase